MALSWDTELFNTFRAKAIGNKSDLVVGQSYPTNLNENLVEVTEDIQNICKDFNVGEVSGTPWLIFADEQDAKDCREQMKVRFVQEEYSIPVYM